MTRLSIRLLAAMLAAAAFLGGAVLPAHAVNEFCNKEIAPLVQERDVLTKRLNVIGKQGSQPGAREKFCSTLEAYTGVIRKTLTYMEQNKDFCAIPDEAIGSVKKGLSSNASLRYKVCVVGAKQAQQAQQAQQQAQQAQAVQQRPGMIKPPTDLQLQ